MCVWCDCLSVRFLQLFLLSFFCSRSHFALCSIFTLFFFSFQISILLLSSSCVELLHSGKNHNAIVDLNAIAYMRLRAIVCTSWLYIRIRFSQLHWIFLSTIWDDSITLDHLSCTFPPKVERSQCNHYNQFRDDCFSQISQAVTNQFVGHFWGLDWTFSNENKHTMHRGDHPWQGESKA